MPSKEPPAITNIFQNGWTAACGGGEHEQSNQPISPNLQPHESTNPAHNAPSVLMSCSVAGFRPPTERLFR